MSDMAVIAPYRIHRMIQDLLRDPVAARSFADDPQPAFDRYGVTAAEAAMLEDRTIEAMNALGVHPNLQMKYLRLRKAAAADDTSAAAGPLDAYLDRLKEG
jgi:hypothetical protein